MSLSQIADASEFTNDGFIFRPLAVPSRGSRELAIWSLTLPSGARSQRHSMSREEVFVVNSGEITATIGGETVVAAIGDALIVPAGTLLEVSNQTSDPATATAITSAGMMATVGDATFPPPWAQ